MSDEVKQIEGTTMPAELFVRMEADGEEAYPLAYTDQDDVVDDSSDEATVVGRYQLIDVYKVKKVTMVVRENEGE